MVFSLGLEYSMFIPNMSKIVYENTKNNFMVKEFT